MKVLIVEDEPITQALLQESLAGWDFEPIVADDALQASQLMDEHENIQLFIIDWSLPWQDGVEFSKRIKSDSQLYSYIIMLTGKSGTDNLVSAMNTGVDDYITKPFIQEELKVRLNVGRRVIEQERKLAFFAQNDALTNVWNRRMIMSFLEKEWDRAKRESSELAILLLDIDHFKKINDRFGHQAGDEALQHFCDLVKSQLRSYDYLGRYGGEEFLLVLPNTSIKSATFVAERIRQCIAASRLSLSSAVLGKDNANNLNEQNVLEALKMTVSIGCTVRHEEDNNTHMIFKRADEAVYQSKAQGRDRVTVLQV